MRGEWRASQLSLVGPQASLALDAEGHVQAPRLAIGFDPDALTIDRLNIQDGKLTLTDAASGSKLTLDKLWFNGEARSLLGPFKGEGAATIGGDLYPFRLASGRYDNGKLALHVNVDPVDYPLSIKADGDLALTAGAPRFDGKLDLTRPVAIAAGSKNRAWNSNTARRTRASS
jgi:large subunit ribosomal protein L24